MMMLSFGVVLENTTRKGKDSGMDQIENIYNNYKGGMGQIPAIKNHQTPKKFPDMGCISIDATTTYDYYAFYSSQVEREDRHWSS